MQQFTAKSAFRTSLFNVQATSEGITPFYDDAHDRPIDEPVDRRSLFRNPARIGRPEIVGRPMPDVRPRRDLDRLNHRLELQKQVTLARQSAEDTFGRPTNVFEWVATFPHDSFRDRRAVLQAFGEAFDPNSAFAPTYTPTTRDIDVETSPSNGSGASHPKPEFMTMPPNNFPPRVTVFDRTLELGTRIPAHTMFTVEDLDPHSVVTRYRFRDNSAVSTSGFFMYRGQIQPANAWFEIPAHDLFEVFYHAGFLVGSESVGVQAFDGVFWSQAAFGTMFTVAPNNQPPIVTIQNASVLSPEAMAVAPLIDAFDPDGFPIVRYMFVDRLANENGGYFQLNGVRMPSATWFTVEASQLESLEYVGGQFGQSERVGVRAFDGKFWSSVAEATFTTTPNQFRPVVTAINMSLPANRQTVATSLFTFSDPDGNTIKSARFLDTGTLPTGGYFTVNGVRQASNVWFEVSADQLTSVRYHSGTQTSSEKIRVQAFDGRFWSTVSTSTIQTVDQPIFDTNWSVRLNELQSMSLSNLFSQVDPGPSMVRYQIIDTTRRGTSAKLTRNGIALAEGVVHTVNALQLHEYAIRGGTRDLGREYDEILFRGFNGTVWSDWNRIHVDTTHQAHNALLRLGSWSQTDGDPVTLTFSFLESVPNYYPADADERSNFQPFTAVQRQHTRDMLEFVSTFANLTFIEVPDDTVGGQMRFGTAELPPGVGGWAYPPSNRPNPNAGDVWLNNNGGPASGLNFTPGNLSFYILLHEVGHALGLKHPDAGTPQLPVSLVETRYTVMPSSAGIPSGSPGLFPLTHQLFDISALQQLYGANTTFNAGDTVYRFPANDANFRVIWDPSGRNTINLSDYTQSMTLDLRPGRHSSIGGVPNNLAIAYGTHIHVARGGRGHDVIIGNELDNILIGNEGNDTLIGYGGRNSLRGGAGNDTYVHFMGSGIDIIDEEQSGGRDTIEIHGFGGFDNFTEDLVFRRLGRDLRIDLNVDFGPTQGTIIVRDMAWGGSRVEVLKLFDVDGGQIGPDVDLTSVFTFATSAPQRYRVTEFQSQFGNLAVPV